MFGAISVSGLTNASLLETIELPYTFHIDITDYSTFDSIAVQGSDTFIIKGKITGTVGKVGGGKQVNLSTNTYDPGNDLSKVIDMEEYILALNSYVPPGPTNTGAFGVHVVAIPVPEPGTLALLGFGSLALATPAYRRWRRKSRR